MDIAVARTFLEILKTGSFVAAAANLNITQTAVSAKSAFSKISLDDRFSFGARPEHSDSRR